MVSVALEARGQGLSFLPIKPGTKKPAWDVLPRVINPETEEAEPKWDPFKTRIPSEEEIPNLFGRGQWFAVICGAISQNLELMDFDIPEKKNHPEGWTGAAPAYKPFMDLVKYHEQQPLIKRLTIVRTRSGGIHLLYRCPSKPEGNQKLAEAFYGEKRETLIETRGEGGYFLTYPTPGYEILQGSFASIPEITESEHQFLLRAARALTEIEEELPQERPEAKRPNVARPGDDYNAKTSWDDILLKHGWKAAGKTAGNRRTWVRPGKERRDGISATTGTGPDLLRVFSSNAHPLEMRAYTKFQAYTILEHGGDFLFAAQSLKAAGYGGRSAPSPVTSTVPIQRGVPPPDALDELESFGEDFNPVGIEFYWDPYLPKGKCVLLDADGGTGKTSLAVGLAAMFSQGVTPITGERGEPLKTLYLHKGEDQSDELETVYRACGGVPGMIRYYRKPDLVFNAEGLERVHNWIIAGKFSLVMVDAFFYFLPPSVDNTNDNLLAQTVVQSVNDVARDTKTSWLNQRHTTKGSIGKVAEQLGMGSVAFRNSHRGQLVARWHPNQRGVIVVEDKKGSILVERGEHFAYRRSGKAIEFIRNIRNPFDESKEQPRTAIEAAEDFIKGFAQDWVYVSALDAQAEARKISVRGALEKAKANLNNQGLIEYRITAAGGPRMMRFSGGQM